MKSWKTLFVKTEETEKENTSPPPGGFSFPASTSNVAGQVEPSFSGFSTADQSAINEVLSVYEKGIDSINMPGYDFYEFYKAISSIPHANDQAYNMAFQMAKSMDNSITPQKLVSDAEFYISKITDVHNQYSMQGQQKINSLQAKKNDERNKLTVEINQSTEEVNRLRNQLQALESEISQKRLKLSAVDGQYLPQETAIRQKLLANDNAKQISIVKLTSVKEGIQKYIK
jgi:hypothetical protein